MKLFAFILALIVSVQAIAQTPPASFNDSEKAVFSIAYENGANRRKSQDGLAHGPFTSTPPNLPDVEVLIWKVADANGYNAQAGIDKAAKVLPTTKPIVKVVPATVPVLPRVAPPIPHVPPVPVPLPTTAPTRVVPAITSLTPLQRWQAWLPIQPAPIDGYVPEGDLVTSIVSAKDNADIVCVRNGKYTLASTARITSKNVKIHLNGSSLNCLGTDPHCAANIIAIGSGATVDGGHILRGNVFFEAEAAECVVSNCFSDDVVYYTNDKGEPDWTGVVTNFAIGQLNGVITLQSDWIGITGSVSFFTIANHTIKNCWFNGSLGEYAYRTEQANGNFCTLATITGNVFLYKCNQPKGSSIGLRRGNGIDVESNWIESSMRIGEVSVPPKVTLSATECNNNITIAHNHFFNVWQAAGPICSDEGTTINIKCNEVWHNVGDKPAPVIITSNQSVVTSVSNIVHVADLGNWTVFGSNPKGNATDAGTVVIKDAGSIPAMPAIPFP